jgi:hypothetical protein
MRVAKKGTAMILRDGGLCCCATVVPLWVVMGMMEWGRGKVSSDEMHHSRLVIGDGFISLGGSHHHIKGQGNNGDYESVPARAENRFAGMSSCRFYAHFYPAVHKYPNDDDEAAAASNDDGSRMPRWCEPRQ